MARVIPLSVGILLMFRLTAYGQPMQSSSQGVFSPGDVNGHWSSDFFATSPSGIGFLVEDVTGQLYVFGGFHEFSGVLADRVVVWDGATWHAMDEGPLDTVYKAVRHGRGFFIWARDVHGGGQLARWDGVDWMPMDWFIDMPVDHLVSYAGDAVVSGCSSAPPAGTGVLRWNGDSWNRMPDAPDCIQQLMKGKDSFLYASWSDSLRQWNQGKWEVLAPLPFESGYANPLAVDKNRAIYATSIAGTDDWKLLQWSGETWAVIELPEGIQFDYSDQDDSDHLGFDDDGNLYLLGRTGHIPGGFAGDPVLLRRQNDAWERIEVPKGNVDAIYAGRSVYITGRFQGSPGFIESIARLDGDTWSFFTDHGKGGFTGGRPPGSEVKLRRDGVGEIYAFIDEFGISGVDVAFGLGGSEGPYMKWVDGEWTSVPDGSLFDAPISNSSNLLIANKRDGGGIFTRSGEEWERLADPLTCSDTSAYIIWTIDQRNDGVLFASGSNVVCGNFIAQWTNGQWSVLDDSLSGSVRSMAWDDDKNLYVGGTFKTVRGIEVNNIARWNGQSWFALGSGLDSDFFQCDFLCYGVPFVSSLLWQDGTLYAGGYFQRAGDINIRGLAAWDGSNWSSVGALYKDQWSNSDGFVATLASDGEGYLYAGGNFNWTKATNVNGVAMWDGSAWQPLGSGIEGYDWGTMVGTMIYDAEGTLWVAGDFYAAGGQASYSVARWIPERATAVEPSDIAENGFAGYKNASVFPNPARESAQISFPVMKPGRYSVALYDVLGRRVRDIFEGTLLSHPDFRLPIEMDDLPSGSFLIVVQAENGLATYPVIHVR